MKILPRNKYTNEISGADLFVGVTGILFTLLSITGLVWLWYIMYMEVFGG